jgi:hypothetical protein
MTYYMPNNKKAARVNAMPPLYVIELLNAVL